jgi:Fe-S-cluster containining protein
LSIEVLSDLRHACHLCGGCCQGVYVRLLDQAEEHRIQEAASTLGVEQPIVGNRLRLDKGRCVFLGSDNLCRIHGTLGAEVKPTLCRQFPLVGHRVDDNVRLGLDPGCYSSIESYLDGPLVEDTGVVASKAALAPEQRSFEERLIDLCGSEGMRITGLLHALTGEPPTQQGGLQPAFSRRVVDLLQRTDLLELLDDPDTSPLLRDTLRPVCAAVATWNVASPPAWPALSDSQEAFALDALQRMLYLRLAPKLPSVAGMALLMLVGVVAVAWSTEDERSFGYGLAAWSRALRAPVFWRALAPDAAAMTWLARGDT